MLSFGMRKAFGTRMFNLRTAVFPLNAASRLLVYGALLSFLAGCAGQHQPTVPISKPGNGPMSDPITELAPQTKTAPTDVKPALPTVTESQLGIPFYPSALPADKNGVPETPTLGASDTVVVLQTRDSVDRVVAFYMDKLASAGDSGKPEPPDRHDSALDGNPVITLSQISGRTLKAAEIRQVDTVTMIELMKMELPASGNASLPNGIPSPGSVPMPNVPGGSDNAGPDSPGSSAGPATGAQGAPQPDRGLKYP